MTRTEPANAADSNLLFPLIEAGFRRLNLLPHIVVGDMGYVDQEVKKHLRSTYGVAVVTKARSNMAPPPCCEDDGCPCCHQGQRLIWDRFVDDKNGHLYYPPHDGEICMICPEQTGCEKEFRFSPNVHETFFGLIPLHSRLSKELLQYIRPLVEAGNEADKHRFNLSGFFMNSLELARTLSYLADACNILTLTAAARLNHGRRYRKMDRLSRCQLELDFNRPRHR